MQSIMVNGKSGWIGWSEAKLGGVHHESIGMAELFKRLGIIRNHWVFGQDIEYGSFAFHLHWRQHHFLADIHKGFVRVGNGEML